MKKNWVYILIIVLILVGLSIFIWNNYQKKENNSSLTLSESEARTIAEKSCIKGGEALSSGTYNENSKTWWFDANLNSVQEGCNPACVVSEETRKAEINWRCTGLLNNTNSSSINNECTCPSGYRKEGEVCHPECYYSKPQCLAPSIHCQTNTTEKCGIENCHGLDIVCGPNIAEVCTAMYMAGDNCRQFASCEKKDGKCQATYSPKFESCKSCVEKCESDFANNQNEFFSCENKCSE